MNRLSSEEFAVRYAAWIAKNKIEITSLSGMDVRRDQLHPRLREYQKDAVLWALRIGQLGGVTRLANAGLTMVQIAQTTGGMNGGMRALERLIAGQLLAHGNHAVLTPFDGGDCGIGSSGVGHRGTPVRGVMLRDQWMVRTGTVRMARDTVCAVCGAPGVEMAFRNGGETFAYHEACLENLLREMCEAARTLLLRLAGEIGLVYDK